MKISIIGTAGRKEDLKKLSYQIYLKAFNDVLKLIEPYLSPNLTIVSGGAAWMDHLAVDLFLNKKVQNLKLYFPADFINGKFIFKTSKDAGSIANYYHKQFSNKTGKQSLNEIEIAMKKNAEISIHDGFKERNLLVGNSDIIIAYTFNNDIIPKDGGTLHTWNNSKSKIKIHRNLFGF